MAILEKRGTIMLVILQAPTVGLPEVSEGTAYEVKA